MKKKDAAKSLKKSFPLIVIALTGIASAYFFFVTQIALAITFVGYAIILIQSRIPLWRLIRGFPGAPTLRILLRAAVYFFPLPLLGLPVPKTQIWGIPAGIGYGLLLLLCQFPALRFALSKDFIAILPPLSREERLRGILHPILSAISQEYFYRGVMVYVLQSYMGFWSVVIAALFFALEHLIHQNASQIFDKHDTLFHTLLGLGLGAVIFFSQSLVGCVLGHIMYNAPNVIEAIQRKSASRGVVEGVL